MKTRFENSGVILITIAAAIIFGLFAPAALADNGNMSITPDPRFVYVNVPTDVTFTIENIDAATPAPISGATVDVSLDGTSLGSDVTKDNGQAVINITAGSTGMIEVTANASGYNDASTTIEVRQPRLNLSDDLTRAAPAVFVGVQKNVTFTINHVCGTAPGGSCSGSNPPPVPNPGATLTLSGAGVNIVINGTSDGMNFVTGSVKVPINATSEGNITVTAHQDGYIDGVLEIPAYIMPIAVLTTERGNYSLGELVNLTLTNAGTVPFNPDRWFIRNSSHSTIPVYISSPLGNDTLQPGNSTSFIWNQMYNYYNSGQVPSGQYYGELSFTYHDMPMSNSTAPFNILNCVRDINAPKTFSSYYGQNVSFSVNLTNTQKAWDVTWYINGTQVSNASGITGLSKYTNTSAKVGTWNVTAVATHYCDLISWTFIWTVNPTPTPLPVPNNPGNSGGGSSGGGGGGGGGGIVTAEPFTNILKFERQDADLIKGTPATYSFTDPVFSIYQVLVTGRENEGSVGLRLEHLRNASALVNRNPAGVVYANENLWIGSKRIDLVVIRFRVNNSWLTANGLDTKNVYLLRFNNGWTKLNSKVINSDGSYTYFEAKTPGLSSFAVSGLKETAQVPTAPVEEINAVGQPEEATGTDTATPTEKKSPGFDILAAGAALVFVAYCIKRR